MTVVECWKDEKLKVVSSSYEFTPRPVFLVSKTGENLQASILFYSSSYFEIHYSIQDKALCGRGMFRINYESVSKEIEERLSHHNPPKILLLAFVEIFEYLNSRYPELYNYVKEAYEYVKCILIGGVEV